MAGSSSGTAAPPESVDDEPALTAEERAEQQRSDDYVMQALNGQRLAEQRQAELAKMSETERALAQRYPGMSGPERWFTMSHPKVLDAGFTPRLQKAVALGERMKLERNSPQLFALIEDALDEYQAIEAGAQALDRDVERARLTSAAQGEPLISPPPAEPERTVRSNLPAIPPPTRSLPMVAPVQREVRTMSGKRTSSLGLPRLTEEERKVARESIPDRPDAPKMTDVQKEYAYAKNKAKYEQMQRDGTYTSERQRR